MDSKMMLGNPSDIKAQLIGGHEEIARLLIDLTRLTGAFQVGQKPKSKLLAHAIDYSAIRQSFCNLRVGCIVIESEE